MSAIEKAAEAIADAMCDYEYMPPEIIADLIKRELEKAVPAFSPEIENTSSRATGWNECRKQMGLE